MNEFVLAGLVACLFVVAKMLESKWLDRDPLPLKLVVRDAILVFVLVAAGGFGMRHLQPMFETAPPVTLAFTDNPPF